MGMKVGEAKFHRYFIAILLPIVRKTQKKPLDRVA